MRTAALSDVLKVITYVVVCFLLAALITPPLYEMGKGFAHVALTKDTADKVTWLATKAENAGFDTYFKRALYLTAILGLVPLFYSLRLAPNPNKLAKSAWSIYLPPNSHPEIYGQPLKWSCKGLGHLFAGFILTSGIFLLMAWFLFQLDWFVWREDPTRERILTSLWRAFPTAARVSLIEELLFRGALLGIFLRAFRPPVAIASLSLLFACAHFLAPPADAVIANPRAANAGFQMLAFIGQKFLHPSLLLESFVALFIVGLILGVARHRTASLWLPIGLHLGWVMAMRTFSFLTVRRADFSENDQLYMGNRMTEGLIPIGALLLTGILLALYLRLISSREKGSE